MEKNGPACAALEIRDTAYYCYDDILDLNVESHELMLMAGTFLTISNTMITEMSDLISANQLRKIQDKVFKLDINNVQAAFTELSIIDMDEESYFKKAYGFNFWENALKIGCILGGGSEQESDRLGKIGKKIGMSYIIANDTWDFGKNLEDFQGNKYTLPTIWALKNTGDSDKKILKRLLGKNLSEKEIDLVRSIMVNSGAIEYGKKRAGALCEEALELLMKFPKSQARDMIEFSTTMTQRNKYYTILDEYRI